MIEASHNELRNYFAYWQYDQEKMHLNLCTHEFAQGMVGGTPKYWSSSSKIHSTCRASDCSTLVEIGLFQKEVIFETKI